MQLVPVSHRPERQSPPSGTRGTHVPHRPAELLQDSEAHCSDEPHGSPASRSPGSSAHSSSIRVRAPSSRQAVDAYLTRAAAHRSSVAGLSLVPGLVRRIRHASSARARLSGTLERASPEQATTASMLETCFSHAASTSASLAALQATITPAHESEKMATVFMVRVLAARTLSTSSHEGPRSSGPFVSRKRKRPRRPAKLLGFRRHETAQRRGFAGPPRDSRLPAWAP